MHIRHAAILVAVGDLGVGALEVEAQPERGLVLEPAEERQEVGRGKLLANIGEELLRGSGWIQIRASWRFFVAVAGRVIDGLFDSRSA